MKKVEKEGVWSVMVLAAVSMSSILAAAQDEGRPGPVVEPAPQAPATVALSLEKFKQQCQDPRKSEVQRAPQDIKLICRNHEVTWVASAPGEVPLKSVRTVSTSVISDKFRVAEFSKSVDSSPTPGSCHRFQEVIEQYAVEVPVTCEQVLHDKFPIEDFCRISIDDSKDKNEVAVQVNPTGRVIDTCSNVSIIQR